MQNPRRESFERRAPKLVSNFRNSLERMKNQSERRYHYEDDEAERYCAYIEKCIGLIQENFGKRNPEKIKLEKMVWDESMLKTDDKRKLDFHRLMTARTNEAISALESLGMLADRSHYSYRKNDVDEIFNYLWFLMPIFRAYFFGLPEFKMGSLNAEPQTKEEYYEDRKRYH